MSHLLLYTVYTIPQSIVASLDNSLRQSELVCFNKFIQLALLIFLFSSNAFSAPFRYSWDIKELARSSADQIELRNERKRLLKKINTNQMRYFYAVKTSIEQVAEIQAEFIIVDGDQPNAFAGQVQGNKNVIGINFAMLDILEMDVHAVAALIGHEMAHLKLKHGEKTEDKALSFGIMKILGGVALNSLGVPAAQTISNLTFTSFETKYSRDNEREADYLGAIWAVEVGYEVDGAVRLQEEIYKRSKSTAMPFLSTHPSGPERIATLKALARRLAR